MKKKNLLKSVFLLCALIVGSSSVWAQSTATITFASQTSGTSDGSTAYTTDNFVSSGIASRDAAFGTITCSATAKCYSGKTGYGLKAGTSSSAGSFTIAFSTSLANVTKITLNRASYNTNNAATITVKNGNTTLASVSTPSGSTDFANMEITNLSIESLSGLTVETTKYCYIKSITITYGNDKATTTTIDASGITNTNKYVGTEAGSLSASVTYGSPAAAVPNASVTWSGDKNTVATINSTTGAVTLVGAGTVTFTASFEGLPGYGTSSATYVMTVTNEDPALSTIWSEDFYGYSADAVPSGGTYSYACTNGTKTSGSTNGGVTAVKDEKLAEGTAKPELMVGKKGSGEGAQGGTFSATIPLASSNGYGYSGDLTLTYKTNANSLNVKTTTSGITVDGESTTGAGVTFNTKETHTVTFKGVTTSTTHITIVFTATTSNNVRLDDIVLKGVLTIPVNENNEIVSNVTIPAGASYVVPSTGIKVPSGKTLTVNGTLINDNTANLIIEDGGQLIHTSAVNATLQKTISAASTWNEEAVDGWYTITPTVASYNKSNFGEVGTYDLYLYNEPTHYWWNANGTDYSFSSMAGGRGYLFASETTKTISYTGEMQGTSDYVSTELSYMESAGDLKGINLVGNRFTRNLVSGDVKLGNNLLTTYYVAEGGSDLVARDLSSNPIKPGQGFIVQANSSTTIEYNPSAKGAMAYKPAFIRIEAGNERFMDRAYVQIGQGNTLRKMNISDNISKVYVMNDDKDYAAVTIEEAQGEMPVNFKANENGQYTLTVNPEGVEMNYLHLIDNMTGADIDLLALRQAQGPASYTFNAKTTDYESRFRLVFAANSNNEDGPSTGSETFAFFSNGSWIINNPSTGSGTGEATLQVIDLNGRILSSETINGSVSKSINATTGIYMMRLISGDNVKTQKVVVK